MLRTIKVYGHIAQRIGQKTLKAAVRSPAEAARFLIANWPDLEGQIRQGHYRIQCGSMSIGEEGLDHGLPDGAEIQIIPIISGAGAVGRIVAGVALVAASFLVPGAALFGIALSPIAFGVGASLVFGGIAQLLTPTPSQNLAIEKDPRIPESFSVSGIQQNSRQGLPVPIVYGEMIVGSIVISQAVNTYIR
jgi:predicted phage tail protein